jgi:hypothetical protein
MKRANPDPSFAMLLHRALPVAALLLAAATSRLSAQRTAAQVAVGGGSATDVRGVSSSAMTVAPSLALWSPNAALRLGLSGTSFTGGGWAAGAGAGADLRFPTGRLLALTLNGAASATATSYRTSYSTVSATPALELRLAPLAVFGGVRAAAGRSSFAIVPAPGPFSQPARGSIVRTSTGPVIGARLTLAPSPRRAITIGYREDRARVDGVGATDRTATLSLVGGSASLTGILGARSERATTTTFGGVRATVGLSRVLALQLGAERYLGDRLTGTLGGRSVTAALVLRTPSGPRPLPRPSGVAAPAEGLTRLSISARDAAAVDVAGDWNGWRPVEAHRGANGVWYADLTIPPGTWRYAFRIDRREWRVPDGSAATEDGFGGKSAWLTVGPAASKQYPSTSY